LNLKPVIEKSPDSNVLILGPCSAESKEQMLELAGSVADLKPDLIRAGIWKPRTRPGYFQGKGEPALDWLIAVRQQFGIPVCTEVANANHVEACLKAGIDVLWVGARTTVNPFYVQEIAEALSGTNVPVMVKNPMNPDLYLWLGAIERFLKAGIERVAAIHRGFSFYGNSIYRNVPRWQIPIELRRKLPGIQLIADISHISGNPAHHLEIAQIAKDLNYDGLMIEVHPHPDEAMSDADQQVSPEFLKKEILSKLIVRSPQSDNSRFNEAILGIRTKIDQLDQDLLKILSKRMRLVEEIGKEKNQEGISIFQPSRWNEIVEKMITQAPHHDLSEEFIFSLIEAIHIESIHHQSATMNRIQK
jgi:chorismate mutase